MLTCMLMVNCVLDWLYEHTYPTKQLLVHYKDLENSPKQIRTLIGLKPCFYNSIETQNYHELLTQTERIFLHFDDRGKQVVFLFLRRGIF